MPRPVTDEALLDALRALADRLERSPSMRDVQKYSEHGVVTYQDRWGSFNGAKEAAGLPTKLPDNLTAMPANCAGCGVQIRVDPREYGGGKNYCSDCSNQNRRHK